MSDSELDERLLIVEDDPGLQSQMRWSFEQYKVTLAETKKAALAEIRRVEPPVVILDLGLPPDSDGVSEGMSAIGEILSLAPHTKIIVVTGNDDNVNPVTAVGYGAYDYHQKPIDPRTLDLVVQRAFRMHELEEENRKILEVYHKLPLPDVIAGSESMQAVCRLIERVAPTDVTTVLLGESGTGKELLAAAIHKLSDRRDERFMAINCAAIPENLLESELFGYEKGAFTDAVKRNLGKIECAHGGTLFLDEIGDLPLALQAKLLRFLQERVIERIGGREEIPVDVRVICATHRDLLTQIEQGLLREDLYYRISEVTIKIPPLRERESDALLLARAMLVKHSKKHGRIIKGFREDALRAISAHYWPGNVRELENKINSAVILADSKYITAVDLDLVVPDSCDEFLSLRQVRHDAERRVLRQALTRSTGNLSRAAELLGITRPTIYDLIKKHRITVPEVVTK